MLVDRVNSCGAGVAFIIFWTPVDELCGVRIGVFLFSGAIASEVPLLSAIEACTLYPSLGLSIIDSGYIPSLQTPSSSSPVSSWRSSSIEIHWDWLVVP